MNLPVKPVCKTGKIRRDGTASIGIQYCFTSEKRALLYSGWAIPPKYWNRRRECLSNSPPGVYGSPSELNQRLYQKIRKAADIISLAFKRHGPPLEFFKLYYKPHQSFECIINEIEVTNKECLRAPCYIISF